MTSRDIRLRYAIRSNKLSLTLQMIEAGVIALEEFSGAYASEQLVAEIYAAMVAAAPVQRPDVSLLASNCPKPDGQDEARY